MAAHPFGPIEKFLITAYKKRRSCLHSAQPCFEYVSTVSVPNPTTNAVWAFSEPRMITQPTLVSGESGYETNVAPVFVDLDLLSRGLGYRITFTMPADQVFIPHAR